MNPAPALPTPTPRPAQPSVTLIGALVDVNAEQSLLGTLLLQAQRGESTFAQVNTLDLTAFTQRPYQLIFLAMQRLHEAGQIPTFQAVKSQLETSELKKSPGVYAMSEVGPERLRELMMVEEGPLPQLVFMVSSAHDRRKMDADADAVKKMVRDGSLSYPALSEQVSALLTTTLLRSGRLIHTPAQTLRDGMMALNEGYNTDDDALASMGWSTGIRRLDEVIQGGLGPKQLYFIGGRPGAGKSILLLLWAIAMMNRGGRPYLMSVEMPAQTYWTRALSSVAQLPLSRIKAKQLTVEELTRLNEVMERLINHQMADKFRIQYKKMPTLVEMRGLFAREYYDKGADAFFMDYAGYRKISFPEETREHRPITIPPTQKMALLVAWLQELADDFYIPVGAAVQMTREYEKRGGVPLLGDIEQSSAAEHDAHFIGLLHEDKEQVSGTDYGKTDLWVRKNRDGARDMAVPLLARKSMSTFSDWL